MTHVNGVNVGLTRVATIKEHAHFRHSACRLNSHIAHLSSQLSKWTHLPDCFELVTRASSYISSCYLQASTWATSDAVSPQLGPEALETSVQARPGVIGDVLVPAAAAAAGGAAASALVLHQFQLVVPPAPPLRQCQHQRQHQGGAQHHEHHPEERAGAVASAVRARRGGRRAGTGHRPRGCRR